MDILSTGHTLNWWIQTIFSSPVEVHAFELGLFTGIVIGVLAMTGFRRVSVGMSVVVLATSLDILDFSSVCSNSPCLGINRVVAIKPWYFLAGGTITVLLIASLWPLLPFGTTKTTERSQKL